ncbi:antitoxin Xre/MbcA/ParS toxin-binding domain-containing protein [Paraburkholderia sp.]|uniref:antitoxin Xre/MbcA/ParS toxin-binding domain-containing protein n=1 Tax=Paraburkholderia sp. TaxID=1926495 RepID=UPI0039C953AE
MSSSNDLVADELRVIRAALEVSGDADKAQDWFRHTPLPCFSGRTAWQLVREGRAGDVLRYIASFDAGCVG